ncbi:uncharacterized protein LOC134241457 [Saccostrea cucullata]|uniref:uncharacterized protein LOC134241457 n=2 Tax=Saccostrea cuccullata TaxID=36930 RepID=UPI002ED1A322
MMAASEESCSLTFADTSAQNLKESNDVNEVYRDVSKWTQVDLNKIGIHYSEYAISLRRLEELAKKSSCTQNSSGITRVPACLSTLENFLTDHFKLCIPHDNLKRHLPRQNVVEYLQYINESRQKLWEDLSMFEKQTNLGDEEKRLLNVLHLKVQDYLSSLGRFMVARGDGPVPDITYTQLVMDFLRIFFLFPQLGKSKTTHMKIGKQEVVSAPDLRFEEYPGPQLITLLRMSNEVSISCGEPDSISKEDFSIQSLPEHILGQHGADLILDIDNSVFYPGILGIICLRTKLIFTYLELTEDHINLIQKGTPMGAKGASIQYTRPYNYWSPEDRKEIYRTLLWLGHLQTASEWHW